MVEMEENIQTHAEKCLCNNDLEIKQPQNWNREMAMEPNNLRSMVDYLQWAKESHMWDLFTKMKVLLLLQLVKWKVVFWWETIEDSSLDSNLDKILQMFL